MIYTPMLKLDGDAVRSPAHAMVGLTINWTRIEHGHRRGGAAQSTRKRTSTSVSSWPVEDDCP
jgi:hypothetical protein